MQGLRTTRLVATGGMMSIAYPFTAIVAQDDMKRALTIAAVDPGIGGVLVLGERGTGKSTTIRALAALLPKIDVVRDCLYQCDPEAPRQALGHPRRQGHDHTRC